MVIFPTASGSKNSLRVCHKIRRKEMQDIWNMMRRNKEAESERDRDLRVEGLGRDILTEGRIMYSECTPFGCAGKGTPFGRRG
jgi:hypothetical protein